MNKNSIPTSHRKISLTIIQIKLLMLFTELIGTFCENHILVFIVFFIVCTVFFVLFHLCISILICFVCTSVRTTATE